MKLLSRNPPSHIRRAKKTQWKYTLCEDARFDLGYDAGEGEVRSLKGRLLAWWKGGQLVICVDYAWDGMTGWPDSADNLAASLAHDLGYQLSNCWNNPFTKWRVDSWLYDLQANPIQKRITLFGVEKFGKLFWNTREGDCSIRIMEPAKTR